MKRGQEYRHEQKATTFVVMLLFILVLLLLQMWLFTSSVDNLLEGNLSIAVPAAGVSLVCLAVNIWVLAGLKRMEEMR